MQDAAPEPGRRRSLARDADSSRRVTLLELFFDLVYIAALALISRELFTDVSWHQALRALILLMAVWWTWVITTMATQVYDPERPAMKLLLVVVMFAALLMTTAIPQAFAERGIVFAVAYAGLHLGRGVVLAVNMRGDATLRRRPRHFAAWFLVSSVFWVAGGICTGPAREALWLVGLAIDYLGLWLAYPVPRRGRLPHTVLAVTPDHLAERYQQFVIIALGDAILVIGTIFSAGGSEAGNLAAFTIAFSSTLLLWRIYVHRSGELLAVAISAARAPGRYLQTAPYTHLVMVAGIVTSAAGFDLFLKQPTGTTPAGWVALILGGPALFLVGRSAFEYEVYSRVSWSRLGGLLALAAAVPPARVLPPLAVAGLAALVLAGVAGYDMSRSWNRPLEEPVPPH
ncbi:low temperature requirement protein A [Micromonospora rosaria]|uniref:Low temperature requirement protein A n=1 Tax=Micromonospora rosaria TaxID=47874 RepID=A0A136PJG8_9ACTN|nr:low temperature requirement protein A [Micromonospora rosaria]KXK58560.1 low temperature requirement protein A [Micromonospora rosaria]